MRENKGMPRLRNLQSEVKVPRLFFLRLDRNRIKTALADPNNKVIIHTPKKRFIFQETEVEQSDDLFYHQCSRKKC